MRPALITLLLIICSMIHGQDQWDIAPVQSLNSVDNEIISGVIGQQVLFACDGGHDYVNDYQWNKRKVFRLYTAERRETYAVLEDKKKLFPYQSAIEEGTACYNATDSILFFSSAANFRGSTGNKLKIFICRKKEDGWSDPELIPFCDSGYDYMHPWFDPVERVLVFSSNRPGGAGKMDIWYSYWLQDKWTTPANPGLQVNTPGNEVFPGMHRGDIYFASDGHPGMGGFDLFLTLKKGQWTAAIQLPAPLNSPGDDMMIFYLNDDKGYLSSNRPGGAGGDDIYHFTRRYKADELCNYRATLYHNNEPVKGQRILVFNELSEIVMQDNTGDRGSFLLDKLPYGQRYVLRLPDADLKALKGAELIVRTPQGQTVLRIKMSANGTFEFELLPFQYSDLALMKAVDKSMLTITLEGTVSTPNNTPVQENEPIMIVDETGAPIAVSRIGKNGTFQFNDLNPMLSYTFKLSEQSKAKQMVVVDRSTSITLPVLKEEATYLRLKEQDAIQLVNEQNQTIYIAPEDVFVINRIYFDYRSNQLTSDARHQLDMLAEILRKNPGFNISIISHTDTRGSAEHNLALSGNRAKAASGYLTAKGISSSRIHAAGMGESEPLIQCEECSDAEHALNRRTEIRIEK
ncbi:MAG: hypothetical protein RL220_1373 [Bacteroidota bacterium]